MVASEFSMSEPTSTRARTIASLLWAILAPILVVSVYLYYSRTHSKDFSGDYIALGLAVLVGMIGVQFLGNNLGWLRKGWVNVAVQLIYICVAAGVLFVYMLSFVCTAFGACL
jgi:hypothetical protein